MAPKNESRSRFPLLKIPSNSSPSPPQKPDDSEHGEAAFQDEILEENARAINGILPTQHPTQVEEKQSTILELIPTPKSSSTSKSDFDHFSKKLSTEDKKPTSEPPRKEQRVGSKRSKRRRDKEGKASVAASSNSSPPSPPKKPPDDNKEEEPSHGERSLHDEILEERERKKSKIPPTEHAAQVEGKQNTASQKLITPPRQSSFPSNSDFDDTTEMPMPSTTHGKPTSKRQRKEQKAGLRSGKRRSVRIAGDKEEKASVAATSSSGLIGSRVFTEEDEIALLRGMIDYGSSHNVSASSIGINVLHELLEGKLHSDFSRTQIYEKVRRLKQKFVKNMKIYETSGEGPVFFKAHEAMAFDLSKNIWAGNDVDNPNNNNDARDRILEDNDDDVKSKKKRSRGKKDVVRELTIDDGADDDEAKDEKDHDDVGEAKDEEDHDDKDKAKDKEDHEDFMKSRLQEEVENFIKKLELRVEVAKLELDAMKKG